MKTKSSIIMLLLTVLTYIPCIGLSLNNSITKEPILEDNNSKVIIREYYSNDDNKVKFILFQTNNYRIIFTNKGAAILSWAIKEKNGAWVELLPYCSKIHPFISNFQNYYYKVSINGNYNIQFEYTSPFGWKINKTYHLSNKPYNIHRLSISTERLNKFIQIPRISFNFNLTHRATDTNKNYKVFTCAKISPNKVIEFKKHKKVLIPSLYNWIAFSNQHFIYVFMPHNTSNFSNITVSNDKDSSSYINFMSKHNVSNNKQNYSISFYLGEKQYTILKRYNIHLENLVNFGMLSFICKPIFFILVLLYNLIGNYGWAIILLAVITQIIMLPLTLKSFKTLAIMKRIQPSIKNIQLKYADDPKRMQLEIFNTYKINKINPLGGCLPTILQFPIFWAFFTILRNICELRNEPWILWIKDLSSPDKLFQIGVFSINILPLIMGIIMLVQQKITTTATAVSIDNNIYDKMVYIMPMLFTIMFWSFPSGLVIYWIINNLFSLLEQYYILRK